MALGFFTGALVAVSSVAAAWFAPQDFTIHNETGHVVVTLNVSPSSETRWGPDILGVDVLGSGESAEITFDRNEDVCLWDIRVTYSDGDTGDWRQINLCETTDITLGEE
jgi:hypothetical protein